MLKHYIISVFFYFLQKNLLFMSKIFYNFAETKSKQVNLEQFSM